MHDDTMLLAALDALGIAYVNVPHEAVFTVEESEGLHRALPGLHTKNLFLKDKAGRFWLVTVEAHARVDLKALPAAIGAGKVSFGKAEDMERLLGVTPGAVTPLAAINDADGGVGSAGRRRRRRHAGQCPSPAQYRDAGAVRHRSGKSAYCLGACADHRHRSMHPR